MQITTRCNMECAHCCYSCTSKGDDMSLDTFRAALDMCEEHGSAPFLGGGEPTIHPHFETILLESIACAASDILDGQVGIITNGKMTRRAMQLHALAKGNVIFAELSRDQYHEPIEYSVVQAFESLGDGTRWTRGTRDTSGQGRIEPLPHGRARELLGFDDDDMIEDNRDDRDCPCEQWVVKPNGDIHQCGCDDSPKVGSVTEGVESPINNTCYRSPEWVDECCENEVEHLIYG